MLYTCITLCRLIYVALQYSTVPTSHQDSPLPTPTSVVCQSWSQQALVAECTRKRQENQVDMAIYFKFKSAKEFDTLAMEGHFISVSNLKDRIIEQKGLGVDSDVQIFDAQTEEGGRDLTAGASSPVGWGWCRYCFDSLLLGNCCTLFNSPSVMISITRGVKHAAKHTSLCIPIPRMKC